MADILDDKPKRRTPISIQDKGWQFAEDNLAAIQQLLVGRRERTNVAVHMIDQTAEPEYPECVKFPWKSSGALRGFCNCLNAEFGAKGWTFWPEVKDEMVVVIARRA